MAVGPRVLEAAGLRGPGRQSRLREWWEQEHVFGYGLVVPAIVLLVTLVAFPFGMAIWFSLSDYWVGSPGAFVGLTNYRDPRQRDFPADPPELLRLHRHRAQPQDRPRRLARDAPRPQSQVRAHHPGHRLLPFVIPTALSTLAWLWMFDSLYSVVNWTAIRRASDQRAGAQLARAVRVRHGRRHRGQRLAWPALLRDHGARGVDGRAQGVLRSRRGGRRQARGDASGT